MDPNFLSIEEFNKQLNEWNGNTIKVSKHELYDIDETYIVLQDISYSRNTRRLDDYESMHALQLSGSGETENATEDLQPLPSSLYEIPLEDTSLYEFDGSSFIISTDRAIYKIERLQ